MIYVVCPSTGCKNRAGPNASMCRSCVDEVNAWRAERNIPPMSKAELRQ